MASCSRSAQERVKRCEGALTKNGRTSTTWRSKSPEALRRRADGRRAERALRKPVKGSASRARYVCTTDQIRLAPRWRALLRLPRCVSVHSARSWSAVCSMGCSSFLFRATKRRTIWSGLLSLARQYANEYLRSEDDDVKKSLQSMIETSQKIDHWVEFARIVRRSAPTESCH